MFCGSPNEISRQLFEIYGHMVFSAGGRTPKCKCLERSTVTEITLDALNIRRVTFGKRYYPYCCRPLDAWIPGIGTFIISVGNKRGVKDDTVNYLKGLGKASTLYWLLLYYRSFNKQEPQDIDLFAILIPYPE